jgi:hypothetical protein
VKATTATLLANLLFAAAGAWIGGLLVFAITIGVASIQRGFGDQFGTWLVVATLAALALGAPLGAAALLRARPPIRIRIVAASLVVYGVFVGWKAIESARPRPSIPPTAPRQPRAVHMPEPRWSAHHQRLAAIQNHDPAGRADALAWISSRLPDREDSRHGGPLVELLFAIARHPWPEAAKPLIDLDRRSQARGDILGRLPLVPLWSIDTPESRGYLARLTGPRREQQRQMAESSAARLRTIQPRQTRHQLR